MDLIASLPRTLSSHLMCSEYLFVKKKISLSCLKVSARLKRMPCYKDTLIWWLLAGVKGRGRARASVQPESWKQQHKVNREPCCRAKEAATLWITEKGKPLANTQVELRGILLNHHKTLAALPVSSFVFLRLHSRWLLCFIQKNAQILSESVTVTHWVRRTSFCLRLQPLQRLGHFNAMPFVWTR